ncbi:MAG: citryl-CoA lyase [Acidimicrobiia bacterium]|nr:citryl-CoA lyase [Acidimicrobiia bacterium]
MGGATPDSITVGGLDLPSEVMGRLSLSELAYLLVTRRSPTEAQARVLDAVLVSLADHGLTPSALATRLTYTGAPEALQGAVAAGLLGAGSVFLGPAGDTALFLADALDRFGAGAGTDGTDGEADGGDVSGDLRAVAEAAVAERLEASARVPGLGHPVHRGGDPRVPRLYEIADAEGLLGPHLRLLEEVAKVHAERSGKDLPINGAGAGGAALVDAGVPAAMVRGVVLIARTVGLVGHLAEELASPLGMPLWRDIEERARADE